MQLNAAVMTVGSKMVVTKFCRQTRQSTIRCMYVHIKATIHTKRDGVDWVSQNWPPIRFTASIRVGVPSYNSFWHLKQNIFPEQNIFVLFGNKHIYLQYIYKCDSNLSIVSRYMTAFYLTVSLYLWAQCCPLGCRPTLSGIQCFEDEFPKIELHRGFLTHKCG